MKVTILDDYQSVSLTMADWSAVAEKAEIVVFSDHVSGLDAVVERLLPFDVVCVMRERTPLPREVLERLPRLKLIASTGPLNASIDLAAAQERGITVTGTGYNSSPAIELTWGLILASARHIVQENRSVRKGGWQAAIGRDLHGKILGVLGLGNVGGPVARIGLAFGMRVIAWSQNMTTDIANAAGASLVAKNDLFRQADVVTIHLVLSKRTRGLVGANEIGLMKPTSILINASRGSIVDERALIRALESRAIAGAAVDVFDQESCPRRTRSVVSITCSRPLMSDTSLRISIERSTAMSSRTFPRGSTGAKRMSGREYRCL